MGGQTWTIPSLNFAELKDLGRLAKKLRAIQGAPFSDEHVDIVTDIIFTALSRAYPSLKKEDLEKMLDWNNGVPIAVKIMNADGFTRPRRPDN